MTDNLDGRLQRLLSEATPTGPDVLALDRVLRAATRQAFAAEAAPRGSRTLAVVGVATVLGAAGVVGVVAVHNRGTGAPAGTTAPVPAPSGSASPSQPPSPPATPPAPTSVPSPGPTPEPALPVVTHPDVTAAAFSDAQRGWAAGPSGVVRTDDGGNVWYRVTPAGLTLTAASRVTLATGAHDQLVLDIWDPAGTPAGTVFATGDGGRSWHRAQLRQGAGEIQMLDDHTGYLLVGLDAAAGSQRAAVVRTTDGGLSWTTVSESATTTAGARGGPGLPLSCSKTGIGFRDAGTGYVTGTCTGGGTVFLTTADGGVHWTDASSTLQVPAGDGFLDTSAPTFETAQDGSFTASAVDRNGARVVVVFTTHNGGASWQSASTPAGTIAAQALPRLGVTWSLAADGTLTVAQAGTPARMTRHPELATSAARLWCFDQSRAVILVHPGSTGGAQSPGVLAATSDGGVTLR